MPKLYTNATSLFSTLRREREAINSLINDVTLI